MWLRLLVLGLDLGSPPDTLSEKVYAALKRDIRGVYQPGAALSEKIFAKKYKSSRTPVRESALRLQHERLMRILPNRGYFVSEITLQELNEAYEYRTALECASAELAAGKEPDPELLERLTELARTPYSSDDRESCMRFIEADTASMSVLPACRAIRCCCLG
jgi:DNA-binding GntR family transcriptional regulator